MGWGFRNVVLFSEKLPKLVKKIVIFLKICPRSSPAPDFPARVSSLRAILPEYQPQLTLGQNLQQRFRHFAEILLSR